MYPFLHKFWDSAHFYMKSNTSQTKYFMFFVTNEKMGLPKTRICSRNPRSGGVDAPTQTFPKMGVTSKNTKKGSTKIQDLCTKPKRFHFLSRRFSSGNDKKSKSGSTKIQDLSTKPNRFHFLSRRFFPGNGKKQKTVPPDFRICPRNPRDFTFLIGVLFRGTKKK